MNNLIIKLLDTPDEIIFNTLTSEIKDITWNEIIDFFYEYLPHKKIDNKYFWGKDLIKLQKFGFDIDFEDSHGNTLLFYLYNKNSSKDKTLSFDTKDIIKNTKKIYHINHFNENILFLMSKKLNDVEWDNPEDFLNGKNLVDFIKKYPNFNLNQVNKLGRNLIFNSLLNSIFPEKLVDFLIENNVDYSIKDNNGYNVLNLFSLINFNEKSSSFLLKIAQSVAIENENKFKDNCISNWLSFIKSDPYHQKNKTYNNWLNFVFENIQNESIYIKNKDLLINKLNDYQEINSPLLLSTIGFLKYKKMDEKLSSTYKPNKKIKI